MAIIFCMILWLWCDTAFGAGFDNINFNNINIMTKQDIATKQGKVKFFINGDVFKRDYRCIVEPEIILEETKKGIFQDGDVIYFKTGENGSRFFSKEDCWIEAEGVSVTMEELEGEGFDFAISIQRNNTNSLAKIKLTFEPYITLEQWEEEEIVTIIPLWLDVDANKENNLFSGTQNTEDILLNERFLTVVNAEEIFDMEQRKERNNLKESLSQMVFTVDNNVVQQKDKTIELQHNIMLTDTGKAMISFEDFRNIVEALKSDQKYFATHTTENYYLVVMTENMITVSLPQKQIQTKDKWLYDVLLQKDGTYYVPLRLFGDIFDVDVLWNGLQKTVTLMAKTNKTI